MKKIFLSLLAMLMINSVFAQNEEQEQKDKFSYALGLLIANNLSNQGVSADDINFAEFEKAFMSSIKKEATEMDANAANLLVQSKMQALQAEAGKKQAEAGKKFLAENAKRPTVKTTASGLQYEVIKEGSGAKPTLQDKVKVHYHGTLIDGKVFDSSVERGQPISFALGQVIKGWQEGVQLMTVGSKYKLFIPYELAYGERGTGGIPGYSTLIFEVELLGINE